MRSLTTLMANIDMAKRVENNHDELNLGQILFMLQTEIKQDQKVGKGTQCFYQQ